MRRVRLVGDAVGRKIKLEFRVFTDAWVADWDDLKPTLQLTWLAPQRIARVELAFDTDCDHPMESVLMGHPQRVMPFCVQQFEIRNGAGRVLCRCADNHQSRRTVRFEEPVTTDAIVIQLAAPSALVPWAGRLWVISYAPHMPQGSSDKLYPNHRLGWAAFIAGKRESRRLLGDIILTGDDCRQGRQFPDGCFPCSWPFDLHTPHPQFDQGHRGNEFISQATTGANYTYQAPYWAPYRCLYSRNIANLFMADRWEPTGSLSGFVGEGYHYSTDARVAGALGTVHVDALQVVPAR